MKDFSKIIQNKLSTNKIGHLNINFLIILIYFITTNNEIFNHFL